MIQTQHGFNADMAGAHCSHGTVMILAEATCRTVIKAVAAECKTDDSERLVRSGSFDYRHQIMAKAMHQMTNNVVRPDALLVVVGGRQCVGSGVARVMALIPVTTKIDAVKAIYDDDMNERM